MVGFDKTYCVVCKEADPDVRCSRCMMLMHKKCRVGNKQEWCPVCNSTEFVEKDVDEEWTEVES